MHDCHMLSFPLQIPRQTSPHDVAATLLAFFASLPVPLLPEAAAQVSSQLPVHHLPALGC